MSSAYRRQKDVRMISELGRALQKEGRVTLLSTCCGVGAQLAQVSEWFTKDVAEIEKVIKEDHVMYIQGKVEENKVDR